MNRTSLEDFSVPSLSLASSRSKRTIPTKDYNNQVYRNGQISKKMEMSRGIERQSRPPIFNSKQTISETNKSQKVSEQSRIVEKSSISRNVYLAREQNIQPQQIPTFRTLSKVSSTEKLLRNPQSAKQIVNEVKNKMEIRKLDAKKSLFDRKMDKLFQQAQFYENQLMSMYADNTLLASSLKQLENCGREAVTINYKTEIQS